MALAVFLEGGMSRLFSHHELEELENGAVL